MLSLFRFVMIGVLLTVMFQGGKSTSAAPALSITPGVSPEGKDYATQVLKNAWDMNEYKDVSKYLNTSGVLINLGNIQVQNGIFSAKTLTADGYFFPLFPGYPGGYNQGAYGENFAIPNKYHCLSFRAKIDTTLPDEIRVFWFADNRLTGGPYGVTNNFTPIIANEWAVYNIDFVTAFDSANSNTPWKNLASWQGLRIDPTTKTNTNFAIDWVRLTDCSPQPVALSWSSMKEAGEIWMGRSAGSMETKIANIAGGVSSYTLRVEGWEAGTYYIAVRNTQTGAVQWSQFEISPAPKVDIVKPSYTSGEGITWQMNGAQELIEGVDKTGCVNRSFGGGILNLSTNPPSTISPDCLASGYSDPKLFPQLPVDSFDPAQYPYLTYKMYTEGEGAWQDINKGWVVRWLWYYYRGGSLCIAVTRGISVDVGWDRYVLDMLNLNIGIAEYTEYGCPIESWSMANPIHLLRFDPNENDMSIPIVQKVDWISLNKVDKVAQGQKFPITIVPSKPVGGLTLSFYITSSLSSTPGSPIDVSAPSITKPTFGPYITFLPALQSGGSSPVEQDGLKYLWDTSGVAKGSYYICIQSQDTAGNVSLDCSEAPVQVY